MRTLRAERKRVLSSIEAMLNFTRCPFCAGHESISPETAEAIARLIEHSQWMTGSRESPFLTELENIRNAILNQQQRAPAPPQEKLPLCPTPQKRKYSNEAHARHDAVRWNQHPYECACTYWHLSKQTPEEHAAKISTPVASADEFEPIDPLLR